MNLQSKTERRIHALLDGSITEEDWKELHETLLEDPKARQLYYDLLCTDQMLRDLFSDAGEVTPETESQDAPIVFAPTSPSQPRSWKWPAVAAALILGAIGLVWSFSRTPAHSLVAAPGSHFSIDGAASYASSLHPGEKLEVADGEVTVFLVSTSQVSLKGPSGLTLLDKHGRAVLHQGRADFDIASADSGIEIGVGESRVVVHPFISRFSLRIDDPQTFEVSVSSGEVQLDRRDGTAPVTLHSNETLRLDGTKPPLLMRPGTPNPPGSVIFDDDFSEPESTLLNGKPADVGGPWKVVSELLPSVAGGGKLDTSHGFKNLSVQFSGSQLGRTKPVTVLTFQTLTPERIWDKRKRLGGIERIILKAADGAALCAVEAAAIDDHHWRIRNAITGEQSAVTPVSALGEQSIKLRCDPVAGQITFFANGYQIARLPYQSDKVPSSIAVENEDGGDLAFRRISVELVDR